MIPSSLRNRPFLPLATERLTLRPVEKSDAASMAALANDLRVAQNLARFPYPYTLQDAYNFITYAQQGLAQGTQINLAIIRRADQTFMGMIGLEEDLGYWLGHEFWGHGYGKEAAKALVLFAFLTLQKESLSGSARADNTASRRIFESLGFKQTGTKECTSLAYKGTQPGVIYGLSRKDFLDHYKAIPRPIVWVVAAILLNEKGEFLLAERPSGKALPGVWEFQGGKIEAGETPEKALKRELKEELDIEVEEEHLDPLTFISYPYDSFHLVMPFYLCRQWKGTPRGAEGQNLKWVTYSDLAYVPLPQADILLCHRVADLLQNQGIWSPL